MLFKIFVVVLLAGQCVDGNERTLHVRESMINFYSSKNNNPSHSTTCHIESESCYSLFDQALANISSNSMINITTNSTLSFHNILQGLQNIQIIGYNNPTVYCTTIIGALQFISCTNCIIRGITWSGCGGIVHDNNYPVLEFDSSSNVKIEKCTFKRSKGQTIVLSGMTGDVTINDCQFYNNKYLGNAGGAVIDIAKQGNYQVNVTVRNCNFTDNEGTSSIISINQSTDGDISFHDFIFSNNIGTAIYLNHQDLHLYGEAYFKNNMARNGGGMFITNNSNVYFDKNSSVEFSQNLAHDSGGAIFLSNNSTVSLAKTSSFMNNQANDGGAIALYNNAHINSNHSGYSSVHGDALFSDNRANSGGAISIKSYSTVTFGSNSTFVNNRANKGGAITLHDNCDITNEEKSIIRFENNAALETGGALHLSEYSETSFVQNSDIIFDTNSASSSDGAVIFSESYSKVTYQGKSTVAFYNNSPHNGTLYSISNSFVTITQYANVTFNDQTSQWYYGNRFTESNDVIIDVDGIVQCSDYREYYICSDNQTCSCKHIEDISNNSEVSITDDLIIDSPINLEMLENISFIGFNNPTITGELRFMSCRILKIKDLTWEQPSRINSRLNSSLTFSHVYDIMVSNCSFQNLIGQVISLSSVSGYVNITHCNFKHNKDGMSEQNINDALIYYKPDDTDNTTMFTIENSSFNDNEYSSLIFLEPSSKKSDHVVVSDSLFTDNQGHCIYGNYQNLYIKKTVLFTNNKAQSGAGIYITNNSNITFCDNSNVTFHHNQAENNRGGAIFVDNSDIVIQNGSRLQFSNNEADQGGAVYSTNTSIIILEETSTMELSENTAAQNGGAIYLETNCKILINGSSFFRSNRAIEGGAIYSKDNSVIKFQNDAESEFVSNEATRNGEQSNGGALYLDSSSIKFAEGSKIIFNKSTAFGGHGGAIYSNSSDVTFMDSSNVTFYDNKVFSGDGGAIFFANESDARFQGMSAVTFTSNRARNGGALHFQNSSIGFTDNSRVVFFKNRAIQYGGGIYLHEIDILFNDNSNVNFTDNNGENGGGIYAETNCTITSEGSSNMTFNSNTAVHGAGVYLVSNSYLFIKETSEIMMLENKATENGGGIYAETNCKITSEGSSNMTFNSNTAVHGAGVYLVSNSYLFIKETSEIMMLENKATENGGGIYSQANSRVLFGSNFSIVFNNNKATQGGAIYSIDDSNVIFQSPVTITFNQNEASRYGGSLYLEDNSTVKFERDSTVTYCKCKSSNGNGGAIYCTDNSIVLIQEMSNVTFNESTAIDGGAIYLNTNCKILINGSSFFHRNRAIEGGAIYSKDNSEIKFQNDAESEFISNEATRNGEQSNGGALYLDSSSIKFAEGSKIIFNKSTAFDGHGGAIYSNNSNVTFMDSSNVIFYDNKVFSGDGGAIFFASESDARFQGMSAVTFTSNRARNGGALHFQNSSIGFTDNSRVVFFKNRAIQYGGGIYLHEIDILFNDNSNVNFTDNNGENGGGIYAETNCTITSEGNSNMIFNSNIAVHGAGVYLVSNSYLFIKESSEMMMLENKATENGGGIYSQANSQVLFDSNFSIIFNNNKATQGGAIYSIEGSNVTFQSPVTITFNQNEASRYGGSLYLEDNSTVKFERDSTVTYYKCKASNGNGGAIYCTDNSVVLIQEMSNVTFNENMATNGGALNFQFESSIVFHNNSLATFNNNTATTSGGAIHFETNSQGIFEGTASLSFFSNSATKSGGAMYLGNNVSLSFDNGNPINTSKMFSKNSAETGGAIFLINSEIEFDNNSVIFDNNTARQDGGAIYSDQSNLSFNNDCNIKFSNNRANEYGGAIYGIFATEMDDNAMNIDSTNIKFEKNDARIAGDSIYINLPQECEQECLNSSILGNVNDIIKHIITSPNELKLYAPTRCIDTDNEECQVYYIDNIMLGQEIPLDACMYDYYNKEAELAQFLVSAYSNGSESVGNDNENFTLGLNTTTISCNHTVPDIRINAAIKDKPKLPHNYTLNFNLFASRFSETKMVFAELTVELSECHEGFYYDEGALACQCYDTGNIVICTGTSSTIRRGYWFGEVNGNSTVAFCPINYCNFSCCETSNGFYQLSPTRENQCRLHRIGAACGKCEPGYTLPYDSPDCIEASDCTTTNISLAVTLTVIYWIVLFVLVFILMHFKVELGYLYGVTYYYSIIDIMLSQNLQLSNGFFKVVNILSSVAKVTPQFLGQFCLFKEMSGIDQQFIHYVHPVAFSLILVMIIMLAKFSGRLTEFISRAIIPIICFLLLLSYTSIATTSLLLMRPLMFEGIDKVYTYLSPDLEYFHGHHLGYTILAIVSTIAIVIFLPALLSLEPYLNRYINFVKVKPILDQFQGCYKDKYRSFAAYYMICRLVIITLIIANSSSDNFVIQYSLIAVCVIIALVHLLIRPYSQLVLNVFDGIVLHIMILVAVIPFVRHYDNSDSNSATILAYILVLLPLTIFIAMEISINKESIKKMIQTIKSFKLKKEKSKNRNEIPLNDVNHEIGIIVDESMRKNALIVDV